MQKLFLLFGSASGAIAVMIGALGAHALKAKLQTGEITADQLASFETAVKYQMYHAFLLIIIFILQTKFPVKLLQTSGYLIIAGTILFSGSIYILTTKNVLGLANVSFLGPITPIGGLLLIAGWISLFISALKF